MGTPASQERKEKKAVKTLPTSIKEKGSPTRVKKKKSMGIRRVTSCAPLLTTMMRGGKSFLKSASVTNKFKNILNRISMKVEVKNGSFLTAETKELQRLSGL